MGNAILSMRPKAKATKDSHVWLQKSLASVCFSLNRWNEQKENDTEWKGGDEFGKRIAICISR